MFTGIIEEIGTVKAIKRGVKSVTLEINAKKVMEDTQVGDSIATNGVCLTVTSLPSLNSELARLSTNRSARAGGAEGGSFTADVMPQSMRMTSFGSLKVGSKVNLERALTLQSRLGGHIVSGHVDGVGTVTRREQDDNALWLYIEAPADIMRYIIDKGSVTLQGVSLTVAKVEKNSFAVSLIPHTQDVTTLHSAKVGDKINIENDIIAKYVERLMPETDKTKTKTKTDIDFYRNFMMNK